jgi:hypothetical protein
MVAPTCPGIIFPSSGSVPSAFWEMLNWGAVDRILWMGVLYLVAWCTLSARRLYKSFGVKCLTQPLNTGEWLASNPRSFTTGGGLPSRGWVGPRAVWVLWNVEKGLPMPWMEREIPALASRSPVTTLTELTRTFCIYWTSARRKR